MLWLDDREIDLLARSLAALTGETLAEAVNKALVERLECETLRRGGTPRLADRLAALGRECAALPDHDTRSADEIAGYGANGLWGGDQ